MPTKKQPAPKDRYHVPNLNRAFLILETLAQYPRGLTLSEITEILNLPKNSVFRITGTLLDREYLLRDEASKRFSLSRKLLTLGYGAISEYNLVEKSLDIMRQLRNATGETVLLGSIIGLQGVVLELVPGSHPVKFLIDPGTKFPLHTSAPGKAMLSFLPPSEFEEVFAKMELKRYTENTITNRAQFCKELETCREKGYFWDKGEELLGLNCIAAPILDAHKYPVASVWTTGPADQIPVKDFDKIGKVVREHAVRISSRLGCYILSEKSDD